MLGNMKTGTKALVGFGLAVGILVVVGGVGWWSAASLTGALRDVAEIKYPATEALAQLSEAKTSVSGALGASMLRRADAEMRREDAEGVREALARIDRASKAYEALPRSEASARLWGELLPLYGEWRRRAQAILEIQVERGRVIDGGAAADSERVKALDLKGWAEYRAIRKAAVPVEAKLRALLELNAREAQASKEAGALVGRRAVSLIVIAILAGAAVLAAIGVVLSRRLNATVATLVREAGKLCGAVATGRLDVRCDLHSVDREFQPIVAGMNETVEAMEGPMRATVECVSRLGKGDVPPLITERYEGEFERLRESLNACIEAVNGLVTDAGVLARAGVEGRLATRADASKHQGDFRKVVQGVNDTLDAVVLLLDAMPAPAFLIDKEFKLKWANAAALGAIGKRAEDVVGTTCSSQFQAEDCNTERCACGRAMREGHRADSETSVRIGGGLEIAYAGVPVRDPSGTIIGAFEVISDQTEVRRALRTSKKLSDYQGVVTGRVVDALNRMARGDLAFELQVDAGDADTASARAQFEAIARAVSASKAAVEALSRDVQTLSSAAVAGELSTRAAAGERQGDFRKIVEGVNATLDAVLAPINEASEVLRRLAERDLRARMDGEYQGDHARMKESVNRTAEALHEALAQVAQAVEQVSSASAQIASSSQAVASGASEQASSLEETTTSIESVASMTRRTAESAGEADQLARTAQGAATEGAGVMEQMQGAMGRIKASAEGTSQIIRDINDIAFQTNLLALNAAVEAARAGEAGRGFAVVAEEVRSLALRAKEAATKTEELIRQSVKEANEGEVTARHVAGKLGEISGGVSKVGAIVAEIAAAAKEQAAGIEQVTKAVGEMDKVTQQNAASAEESSSAASELSGQAEELAAMVAAFQLEGARRAAARKASGRAQALPAARAGQGSGPGPRAAPAAMVGAPPSPVANPFPMDLDADARDF